VCYERVRSRFRATAFRIAVQPHCVLESANTLRRRESKIVPSVTLRLKRSTQIRWLDCHRALDSVETESFPKARLRVLGSQTSGLVVLAAICKLLFYLDAIEVCLVVAINLSFVDSRYVVY